MDKAKILPVELKWFERGSKEAIHIRLERSSPNSDIGWYSIPSMWNNTFDTIEVGEDRPSNWAISRDDDITNVVSVIKTVAWSKAYSRSVALIQCSKLIN